MICQVQRGGGLSQCRCAAAFTFINATPPPVQCLIICAVSSNLCSLQCHIMCSMHCKLYNMYTLFSVKCGECSLHCYSCNTSCAVSIICAVCSV